MTVNATLDKFYFSVRIEHTFDFKKRNLFSWPQRIGQPDYNAWQSADDGTWRLFDTMFNTGTEYWQGIWFVARGDA